MPYLDIGDNSIYFDHYPSGAEISVVFIHGAGGSRRHWPETVAEITEADVYCVDLPGHGRSNGDGCSAMAEYADTVEAFCRQLGPVRVVLAGHSMGGGIAQTLALRSPRWMTAAVLVGTGSRLRVHPAILEALMKDSEHVSELLSTAAFGPDAKPEHLAMFRRQFQKAGASITHGDFLACDRFDISDRLSKISMPVLVVSGEEDRLTPVKYGKFLHERIADSRFICIERAGHMMALEKADVFISALREFLRMLS